MAIIDTLTTLTERRFPGQFTTAPIRYPHVSLAYSTVGAEDVSAAGREPTVGMGWARRIFAV
ncbi:hypothetical protein [Streptomyces sp. NPDC051218]|uniref:hypothetical protein n=1 Tax=Streptomyces sp. NPDC051218 TaxID=3365645 RepID=UPI00378C25CE